MHAVGPDLRIDEPSWEYACDGELPVFCSQRPPRTTLLLAFCSVLGRAYYNVLRQFLDENARRAALSMLPLQTLRLLPISGGIFAGEYQERIAPLTVRALSLGFRRLPTAEQRRLRDGAFAFHLCVFLEKVCTRLTPRLYLTIAPDWF